MADIDFLLADDDLPPLYEGNSASGEAVRFDHANVTGVATQRHFDVPLGCGVERNLDLLVHQNLSRFIVLD